MNYTIDSGSHVTPNGWIVYRTMVIEAQVPTVKIVPEYFYDVTWHMDGRTYVTYIYGEDIFAEKGAAMGALMRRVRAVVAPQSNLYYTPPGNMVDIARFNLKRDDPPTRVYYIDMMGIVDISCDIIQINSSLWRVVLILNKDVIFYGNTYQDHFEVEIEAVDMKNTIDAALLLYAKYDPFG